MSSHVEQSKTALVLVDFINDIVTEGGKLARKGYPAFIKSNNTEKNVIALLTGARKFGWTVIHVRVGFSTNYIDHPKGSPLFGAAKEFGALALGRWGTEFAEFAKPLPDELVITKHRVSAFYGTDIEVILKTCGIQRVVVAGCATDLAVQSAARDAHDRDYSVVVAVDACAAANESDHFNSLAMLEKISTVSSVDGIIQN